VDTLQGDTTMSSVVAIDLVGNQLAVIGGIALVFKGHDAAGGFITFAGIVWATLAPLIEKCPPDA